MKTRRILSIVVAAILVVSTLAIVGLTNVFAIENEISTAEQFAAITDGNYKLTADIDLTTIEFTTIASFNGTLDGNGKTVTVSKPLFGTLTGEVENLTIAGAIAGSSDELGALAKVAGNGATVTNVTNNASVTAASNTRIGGLVGKVDASATVTFTRCVNNGAIQGKEAVGGIIAWIGKGVNVTVHESINNGTILMADADAGVGGIIGSGDWGDGSGENVTITYCMNTGAVSSIKGETAVKDRGRAAGIIGRLSKGASKLVVDHCYNIGTITLNGSTNGDDSAAGIASYVQKAHITNCYNIGDLVSTAKTYEIGRSRTDYSGSCSDNYYVERGFAASNGTVTGAGVADKAALCEKLLTLGYAINPNQNEGYPILAWQCTHGGDVTCVGNCAYCGTKIAEGGEHTAWGEWDVTEPTVTNDGVAERVCGACGAVESETIPATATITPVGGVYEVYTEDQFEWLFYNMNAEKLALDISIAIKNDLTFTNGFTYVNKTFTGTFDGENHTISGIKNAFFVNINGGTFKNVTLEGSIASTEKTMGVVSARGESVQLINVHSKVDLTIGSNEGDNYSGLVGYTLYNSLMEDCIYSGTITVNSLSAKGHVGGFVGYNNSYNWSDGLRIINGVFDGKIILQGTMAAPSGIMIGGFVGYNSESGPETIKNCVNKGEIDTTGATVETSDYHVGGIVGVFRNTSKSAVIENCIVAGTINGSGTIGSIAGKLSQLGSITNSASLTTEYPVCADGEPALANSFAGADVEKIGGVITLGGVSYQKYNFGYVNATTSAFVTAGLTSGDKAIGGYLSLRDDGDKHDARIVLVANITAIDLTKTMTITFTKNGDVVKTFTATFEGEGCLEIFNAGLAAGEPYFAANGYALFGAIVNDIPDDEWDTISVSYGETEVGSLEYAQ